MARSFLVILFAACAFAQQPPPKPVEPPEEDETLKPKEYEFNPLQAENEVKVGKYYFKKGSWKAASLRFLEATRWDPNNAEAWLRLGESREKLRDQKGAKEAIEKYLALAPEAKDAAALRKKWKLN